MAFDRNDQLLSERVCGAVIVVRDPAVLARRIAGVAALSRQVIELARAGFGEVTVLADAPPGLQATIQDDLERAGQVLPVRFDPAFGKSRQARGAFVLNGAIVKASSLILLTRLDDPPVALQLGARIVARQLRGEGAEELGSAAFWSAASVAQDRLLAIGPGEAIPLDSPAAAARMVLRNTSKPSDGLVSRYLNRPISRLISAWLLRWSWVRPGHATVLTALAALAMFLSLARATPISLALGCLLFHAASVIDGVDGEIARATYRASARGAALDTAVDMASNVLFAIGLTIGLTRLYGAGYLQIGAFSSVGLLIGIVSMTLLSRRNAGGGSFDILKNAYGARAAEGAGIGVVTAVRIATSRDFFAFVFAMLGAAGLARAIPGILAFGVGLWLLIIAGGASIIFNDEDAARQP